MAGDSAAMYPALIEELRCETGIDAEYETCGALVLPPYDQASTRVSTNGNGTTKTAMVGSSKDGVFLPSVAHVRSPRLLRALAKDLERRGVTILERVEVLAFYLSNSRVSSISTSVGAIEADSVIVCAGAWSRNLLGELACGFETEPVKGQMLLFRCLPGTVPSMLLQGELYLVPRRDGHILAGSSIENTGFDKSTTTHFRTEVLRWAKGLFPALNENSLVSQWAGLRPGSAMPTIARHPEVRNLYMNCGHFRHGLTMAPGSARLLADIIFHDASSDFPWPSRLTNERASMSR